MKKLREEKLRVKIHEVVSKGCRLCDYWDDENYHCMLNIPIHPAYPCAITDQTLALIRQHYQVKELNDIEGEL